LRARIPWSVVDAGIRRDALQAPRIYAATANKIARNQMATTAQAPKSSKTVEFICPECGRTFSRAAALGAHRRQAHGVVGAVSAARARRNRARSASKSGTRKTSTSKRSTARSGRAAGAGGKTAATSTAPSGARSRRRPTRAQAAARPPASDNRATRVPRSANVNRDALLASLFPNGLPAKEDVLRAANQWLDEAERLARMR